MGYKVIPFEQQNQSKDLQSAKTMAPNIKHAKFNRNKPSKSKQKQISNSLVVNNHTFTGIWAKTKNRGFDSFEADDSFNEEKYDQDGQETIHSMFENKQNQQTSNVYAYSMIEKHSSSRRHD